MYLTLLLLNLADYIITLHNRGNFVEANKLMELILDNTLILSVIKLFVLPMLIFILWKYKSHKLAKIGVVLLCAIYTYAVVVGILYTTI